MTSRRDRCRYIRRVRLRLGRRNLRLAGLLLALAAALVLGGCGGEPSGSDSSAGSKVQLVYQDWRTEWFPPMAQRELAEFQSQHPEMSVFYTPDPEDLGRADAP